MPDVFTRMHAVSVGDTLGTGLLIAGMALQAGPTLVAVKLFLILLVIWFTGPVATHALARAALQDKLLPLIANRSGKLVEGDPDKVAPRASKTTAKKEA
jgi:multicomponent Na+:H+ antiporter subunit G